MKPELCLCIAPPNKTMIDHDPRPEVGDEIL